MSSKLWPFFGHLFDNRWNLRVQFVSITHRTSFLASSTSYRGKSLAVVEVFGLGSEEGAGVLGEPSPRRRSEFSVSVERM